MPRRLTLAGSLEKALRKAGYPTRKVRDSVWVPGVWFFCAPGEEEEIARLRVKGVKVVEVSWTPNGWDIGGEKVGLPPTSAELYRVVSKITNSV